MQADFLKTKYINLEVRRRQLNDDSKLCTASLRLIFSRRAGKQTSLFSPSETGRIFEHVNNTKTQITHANAVILWMSVPNKSLLAHSHT